MGWVGINVEPNINIIKLRGRPPHWARKAMMGAEVEQFGITWDPNLSILGFLRHHFGIEQILSWRAPGWRPLGTYRAKGLGFQLLAQDLTICPINKGGIVAVTPHMIVKAAKVEGRVARRIPMTM